MAMAKHPLSRALVACLLTGVATASAPPPDAAASAHLTKLERSMVKRVNRIRAGHGLPRVVVDRRLNRSADYHSADMLAADFFAHSSSNGASMAQRLEAFRPSRRLGEVIAYVQRGRRSGGARQVVRMWMESPSHRASLLTRAFRRIGVARRNGRLNGMRVAMFTMDLASRR